MDLDDVVYSSDRKVLTECKNKEIKKFTVDPNCKIIANHAFEYCSKLTKVDLSGVEKVEAYAFAECSSLQEINNLQNVKTIELYAFQNCWRLKNFDLPECLVEIGACAFEGCICLEEITIPASIQKIGYRAFADCANLKRVKTGNIIIYSDTFEGCIRLQQIEKK